MNEHQIKAQAEQRAQSSRGVNLVGEQVARQRDACGTCSTDSGSMGMSISSGLVGFAEGSRPTITLPLEVHADKPFAYALDAAQRGYRITRRGWNAGGQWVQAQYPDKGSKMSTPYLFLKNANHDLVPWTPSQGDLFANDWAIIPAQPVHAG